MNLPCNRPVWHRQTVNPIRYIASVLLITSLGGLACDNSSDQSVPSEAAPERAKTIEPSLEVPPESSEEQPPKVVAWINGEPLEEVAIDRQLRQMQALYGAQKRPLQGQELELKKRMVAERLIDRRLIDQWLKAQTTPPISNQEVDRALTERVRESFGSQEVLERHLARRGVTLAEYREDLRRRLLLERTLPRNEEAGDAGVADVFEEVVARPAKTVEVRAASLFVPWSRSVPKEQVIEHLVTKASAASRFSEFTSAAREVPMEWRPSFRPDTGWTKLGETAGDVEKVLFATQSGRATEVITTPVGAQLFFVLERREDPTPQFREHQVALQKHSTDAKFLQKRALLLRKLRDEAVVRWESDSKPTAPTAKEAP